MRIFLIGMPGSGKSYWMAQLAQRLDYDAVDMDQFITEQSHKTIPELFAISEEHFREEERRALQSIIEQYKDKVVIATGGGSPVYKNNLQLMKDAGCVLYLETSMEALLSNIALQGVTRPMLVNGTRAELADKLSELYRQRKEIYEQAHAIIHADTATLVTFADAINKYLTDQNSASS
jgi:shikimate kinase